MSRRNHFDAGHGMPNHSASNFRRVADSMGLESGPLDRPFRDTSDDELKGLQSGSRKHIAQTFGPMAAIGAGAIATIATGGVAPLIGGAVLGLGSLIGFGGRDKHDGRIFVGGAVSDELKTRKIEG